jgi:hypothetical protein
MRADADAIDAGAAGVETEADHLVAFQQGDARVLDQPSADAPLQQFAT